MMSDLRETGDRFCDVNPDALRVFDAVLDMRTGPEAVSAYPAYTERGEGWVEWRTGGVCVTLTSHSWTETETGARYGAPQICVRHGVEAASRSYLASSFLPDLSFMYSPSLRLCMSEVHAIEAVSSVLRAVLAMLTVYEPDALQVERVA